MESNINKFANAPKRTFLAQVSSLASQAEDVGAEPHDVIGAIADNYDLLSMNGSYYKLQAISLKLIRPLGTTVVFLLGVMALCWILEKSIAAAWRVISRVCHIGKTILVAAESKSALGLLESLFTLSDDSLPTRDAGLTFTTSLKACLPGPLLALHDAMANVFDDLSTTSGVSVNADPNTTAANSLPLNESTSPQQQVAAGSSLGGLASTAIGTLAPSLLNGATDLLSSLGSGISSMFGDASVRDEALNPAQLAICKAAVTGLHQALGPDGYRAFMTAALTGGTSHTDAIVRDALSDIRERNQSRW